MHRPAPINASDWDIVSRRQFSKIHGTTVDNVLRIADSIEFDGNCPMLGITIEAWAVANVSSNNPIDAKMAELIVDGYFFGRYQPMNDIDTSDRERGFNLNSRAYYAVRSIRTRLPGQLFDEAMPNAVLIFRDYDLSPKTFIYTPKPEDLQN